MKSNEGFTQIDHELLEALTAADITRAALKTMLVVIRLTLGYHQEEAEIGYAKFRNRTNLSRPTVKAAIRELISFNMISRVRQGTREQTSIYRINADFWTWTLPQGDKRTTPGGDKRTYPEVAENLPRGGQVTTPVTVPVKIRNITKDIKDNNDHLGTEVVLFFNKVIEYYRKVYREHTGKSHPFIKPYRRARLIEKLVAFADEHGELTLKNWKFLIRKHFQRKLITDWRIFHFATPGILENLFFKNLY